VLDREPDLARGDAVLVGNVLMLISNCAEDPGDDDALHALPSRAVDRRGIRENVVGVVITLQGEHGSIIASHRESRDGRDRRP
jgi:hypothetical protein